MSSIADSSDGAPRGAHHQAQEMAQKGVTEDRDLTVEEQSAFDGMIAEAGKLHDARQGHQGRRGPRLRPRELVPERHRPRAEERSEQDATRVRQVGSRGPRRRHFEVKAISGCGASRHPDAWR
jgi:hypothetical protein